jgi:hypothetical protein
MLNEVTNCCRDFDIVYSEHPWYFALLNKSGNVRLTLFWGSFLQPLLQLNKITHYTFCVCVYRIRYPVRNSHAPCCYLWLVWLYNIFPHYLIKSLIFFKKKYLKSNVYFDFLYKFSVRNISHSKKNGARYD